MTHLDSEKSEAPEVWIITRAEDAKQDFDVLMMRLGGETRNVDAYYSRDIEVEGEVRKIRGRFELLIRKPDEKKRMLDKLHPHGPLRRVTEEEQAAIEQLEHNHTSELGGRRMVRAPETSANKDKKEVEKQSDTKSNAESEGGYDAFDLNAIADFDSDRPIYGS